MAGIGVVGRFNACLEYVLRIMRADVDQEATG